MSIDKSLGEPAAAAESPIPAPAMTKKEHALAELKQTEHNYVEALNMIQRNFERPLKPLIRQEDFQLIFMNIDELAQLHRSFHDELKRACDASAANDPASNQGQRILQCFVRWKMRFTVYAPYCAGLLFAQDRIDEIARRDEHFRERIKVSIFSGIQ